MEELATIAKHAERHPREAYLIDNIPGGLTRQVMKTLIPVNNIHSTAKPWDSMKVIEIHMPKSRRGAEAACSSYRAHYRHMEAASTKRRGGKGRRRRKDDAE